jgi:hypothetical protein
MFSKEQKKSKEQTTKILMSREKRLNYEKKSALKPCTATCQLVGGGVGILFI